MIANNNGGTFTVYNSQGNENTLMVTIPGAAKTFNGNCSPGCPTGNVANTNGSYFGGGSFIFDTEEDGIVANWTGDGMAALLPSLGLFGTLFTTRKTESAWTQEHSVDEHTGAAPCGFAVHPRMR